MPSILDNDVEAASTSSTTANPGEYPVTDLVRTYLTNAGSKFFGLRSARRQPAEPPTVHDLWDYLGDFA